MWQNNTFAHICTDCICGRIIHLNIFAQIVSRLRIKEEVNFVVVSNFPFPRYEQFSIFDWTHTSEPFETLVIIKVLFWHLCVHFAFNCVNLRKLKSNLDPESLNLLYHSHIYTQCDLQSDWFIFFFFYHSNGLRWTYYDLESDNFHIFIRLSFRIQILILLPFRRGPGSECWKEAAPAKGSI